MPRKAKGGASHPLVSIDPRLGEILREADARTWEAKKAADRERKKWLGDMA